jgi:hypothetical protein
MISLVIATLIRLGILLSVEQWDTLPEQQKQNYIDIVGTDVVSG